MQRLAEIASGVLAAVAEFAMTTSTVVTAPDGGCLVIDPAVSVADLAGIAADLAAAGLEPRAGFATHPHWDHVLWSAALGDVPRYAAAAAAASFPATRDHAVRELEETAPGHDLDLFGRLAGLPADAAAIPWDGPAAQLIVHDGHAPGHGAVFLPDAGVLVAGDMLSDIEMPLLDTGAADPLGDYRAGLEQLAGLTGVRLLVPGHGHLGDGAEFRRRVDADRRYLDLLAAGQPFSDPRAASGWLLDHHRTQLAVVAGRSGS
jgi:glyoxylase-like metal-dependent hydrolase (beta-lactamase superfamily II)